MPQYKNNFYVYKLRLYQVHIRKMYFERTESASMRVYILNVLNVSHLQRDRMEAVDVLEVGEIHH
jgi:hypothetical protein